jgi:hypothetical protein
MKPHKIRSFFTPDMLAPPLWVQEFIDLSYADEIIIEKIDQFEFYIAIIIGCTLFIYRIEKLNL